MNEHPQDMPDEEEIPSSDSAQDPTNSAADEGPKTPDGMLPLVAPFFGKKAFLIAAVPFLVYFIGSAFGGYLEKTRKTQPAHEIRGMSRSFTESFLQNLRSQLPEQAEEIIERYNLRGVEEALDDESSKVKVLVGKCQKLLDGKDFANEPPGLRQSLVTLRAYVEEFLDLYSYWEDDELNKIRPSYIQFAKTHLPNEELRLNDSFYPVLYTIAFVAALLATAFALPTYLRKARFRISFLAVGLGVLGVVLWIAIWWLNKEYGFGNTSNRAAFNPLEELKETPAWMWTFLGIRLMGMVILVPIVEEFFLRGFLMRYCEDIDWDQIPIGEATWRGWAGILAYAAFTHVEIVAALVWFGMVTWMYLKTKNIWDCVVTHAVTNGLLAAYVLATGTWALW